MEEKSVAIKDARTLGVPEMLLLGLRFWSTTILKEKGFPFR